MELNRGFPAEFRRVILLTLLSIAFGLINGQLEWTLILCGGIYMAWTLWRIRQLDLWLKHSQNPPPDFEGIWGEIVDSIVRLQNHQKRERNRLQAVISRTREVTDSLHNGIVLLDANGNIDMFNPAARRMLGLRAREYGSPLVNFLRHPSFIEYFESGDYDEPLELPAPRSESTFLQLQVNRFGQGEAAIVIRDITRLQKLQQVRKDFVANASHELRTPLTVLKGYIETLKYSDACPKPWEKPLAQMEQQANRMSDLIVDLLSLSKLESKDNQEPKTSIRLQRMLEKVVEEGELVSGDKNHSFKLECDPALQIDGYKKELRSAFTNLITNAVKYSEPGTEIKVSARIKNNKVHVSFIDRGEGIDPVHLPRLTERFYRADDSHNSQTGGTGLGLAIVKHILTRHNAELEIDSKVGRGSTFTCIFASVEPF
ncbi:MAG: phosphate regulon sensor histidine kinase PhoR [Candidatus Pelagadaptatus aseana]|uniref:phosphate regulon sensor histidine kinase PhoR n=1 Tax=Candidatus Pelagadaptatus aseana TaxID=3120508 RepID=UPI0039B1C99F